jgi:alkylation response protein AidB-like acyl-CoA dehydrogenase
VHFRLTSEQRALQSGMRDLCQRRGRPTWEEMTEVGVFSLRVPEAEGGAGLGMAEAVLVFEELGRCLAPGPLIGTHLAAGVLPLHPVPAARSREASEAKHAGRADQAGGAIGIVERDEAPLLVEHPGALDSLVVLDRDGAWLLDPGSVEAEPVEKPVDPLTPMGLLTALPQGERLGGPDLAGRWRHEGAVLAAALQLGIAEEVTDRATAYAKEREQFGRKIGSFQALKHLMADMFVRAEVARAAVYAAAVALDDPAVAPEPGGVGAAVATAKLLADDAAQANARAGIQVHGGMGFTWEVDLHLYLKRAWVLATAFGTADEHEESLAELL